MANNEDTYVVQTAELAEGPDPVFLRITFGHALRGYFAVYAYDPATQGYSEVCSATSPGTSLVQLAPNAAALDGKTIYVSADMMTPGTPPAGTNYNVLAEILQGSSVKASDTRTGAMTSSFKVMNYPFYFFCEI